MHPERFELIDFTGAVVAVFPDSGPNMTPFATEAILHWLRGNATVLWRPADQPDDPEPAMPKPSRRAHAAAPSRQPAGSRAKSIAKFAIGDRVYLKWLTLDEQQRLHLSSYRTTPGEITNIQHAVGTSVRFNSDPDPFILPSRCLSHMPEIEA